MLNAEKMFDKVIIHNEELKFEEKEEISENILELNKMITEFSHVSPYKTMYNENSLFLMNDRDLVWIFQQLQFSYATHFFYDTTMRIFNKYEKNRNKNNIKI